MLKNHRRTWAEIDLDAIEHNIIQINSLLKNGAQSIGVIKADAYGHGAPVIARTLTPYVGMFALSEIDEVIQLYEQGIQKDCLILGYTPPQYTEDLLACNAIQTVFSYEYAQQLYEHAQRMKKPLRVHIKLDTGMSRLGFSAQDDNSISSTVQQIAQMYREFSDHLIFDGIFTHFACSDQPENAFTGEQFDHFCKVTEQLAAQNVSFRARHVCNSAGIINHPQMHLDMVRPGIILYGLKPDPQTKDIGLRPALTLKTVVSQVHQIAPGTTVSYGRTFTAKKKMTIATLPVGYADGYSRLLSNTGQVLIRGQRANIIGRICMDQCMIDVSELPPVQRGEPVTLIGTDGTEQITADEIADKMHTINYEVPCLIGKRVPRVYFRQGQETECYSSIL